MLPPYILQEPTIRRQNQFIIGMVFDKAVKFLDNTLKSIRKWLPEPKY